MAALTVQDAPAAGLAGVTFTAADVGGDTAPTGPGVVLLVRNDDASAHTATVETPGTVLGLEIEDPAVAVAAGGIGVVPLLRHVFGAAANITYDDVTSVSVAAVRMAR